MQIFLYLCAMKKIFVIIWAFISLFCASCKHSTPASMVSDHARYFSVSDSLGYPCLTVYAPADTTQILASYAIPQPYTRLAVTSATHIGLLDALQSLDKVAAMTTPEWVYNHPQQSVIYIGEDLNLNLEQLFLAHPQALLITSYGQPLPNLDRIREAGIEVIQMVEWQEQTPLARAEWIKFVGALVGKQDLAKQVYDEVCERYHNLIQTWTDAPLILSGAAFRGTWYVPSGGTYMGRLFRDAGAGYPYYDDLRQSSIPLSLESVIHDFGEADAWVGANARSYEELATIDSHHTWFRAYQNKRVYNWYKQSTPAGANNFWERGIVHPDEILEDLITILRGEASDTTKLHFAAPLR